MNKKLFELENTFYKLILSLELKIYYRVRVFKLTKKLKATF